MGKMKIKITGTLLTSCVLALTACSSISPVTGSANEKEFKTQALTFSYILRKLNRFIADDNGNAMVKELLFGQFKYETLLREIISENPDLLIGINAMEAVRLRREQSPSFDSFIASLGSAPAIISTFAGNGEECSDPSYLCGDGDPATSASLSNPGPLAVDSHGNVYIGDSGIRRVRKIFAGDENIYGFAGNGDYCSDPTSACGDNDDASNAVFGDINGLAVDTGDNIYILDAEAQKIRKVNASDGKISTVAGTGEACSDPFDTCGDGGDAVSASLGYSQGIAVDTAGNIYIADAGIRRIRKINASDGKINTIAGNGEECPDTESLCGDGEDAASAALGSIEAIALDKAGNIYVTDGTTRKVKIIRVSDNKIYTFAGGAAECSDPTCGDGGPATEARFMDPRGLAIDNNDNVYITDVDGRKIRKVNAGNGKISTVAGDGNGCSDPSDSCGDGEAATRGQLGNPTELAVDSAGNIYVNDSDTQKIRKIK
jgi:sugar lactone lactonase YvrE